MIKLIFVFLMLSTNVFGESCRSKVSVRIFIDDIIETMSGALSDAEKKVFREEKLKSIQIKIGYRNNFKVKLNSPLSNKEVIVFGEEKPGIEPGIIFAKKLNSEESEKSISPKISPITPRTMNVTWTQEIESPIDESGECLPLMILVSMNTSLGDGYFDRDELLLGTVKPDENWVQVGGSTLNSDEAKSLNLIDGSNDTEAAEAFFVSRGLNNLSEENYVKNLGRGIEASGFAFAVTPL